MPIPVSIPPTFLLHIQYRLCEVWNHLLELLDLFYEIRIMKYFAPGETNAHIKQYFLVLET